MQAEARDRIPDIPSGLDLIDTHIHLDAGEFFVDRGPMLAAARQAGVRRFVIPAVAAHAFSVVRDLAATMAGSAYALGIHPLFVGDAREEDIETLRTALAQGGACAVGEIGLDGYPGHPDPERQEWFFVEQLKLAREFQLPVILHVRRAQDRVLKYLRRYPPVGGIAHAFNGSPQQAEIFISMGLKLGFGGAMTYSGSTRIRELARSLPLEAIVLESDAPDIPPAWQAKSRNEPVNIARFAAVLAELRDATPADIARATTTNALVALPALADPSSVM